MMWFIGVMAMMVACSEEARLSPLPEGATIVAFGDSLTFGTGVTEMHSYPEVLAQLSGYQVIRSGVPGEVTSAGLSRLPKVLSEHKPALVILGLGGNDILRRKSKSSIKQNLASMIGMIRQQGAEVLLIGMPDFGLIPSTAKLYLELAEDADVPAENQIITELIKNPAMKSDTIHFNREGYRELANEIYNKLVTVGAFKKQM